MIKESDRPLFQQPRMSLDERLDTILSWKEFFLQHKFENFILCQWSFQKYKLETGRSTTSVLLIFFPEIHKDISVFAFSTSVPFRVLSALKSALNIYLIQEFGNIKFCLIYY